MTINCDTIRLTKGNTGENVKTVQTILKNLGYYDGKIDGEYGNITVDAVKKFQSSQQLITDGWIGPVTCRKLQQNETNTTSTITSVIGKKFYKETIEKASETFRKHIKNNKNYPNFLEMVDNTGKSYNVGRSEYMGIFESVSIFFVKNGRVPNYVVATGTANNPLAIDYQNTNYSCGPTSLSMCFQMLAKWVTESTLSRVCGTTTEGTGPNQLIQGVGKYGFKLVEIGRNKSSVSQALKEGSPVLMHIKTNVAGGKSCLGYRGDFGHYIMCYGVSGDYYLLADPTKGFKTCLSSGIDTARSSSYMKYYRLNTV